MLTDYHAKYFAHDLTKRCASDNLEKLAGALVDAQVDLNPHQVEAALFAFRSPLSRGAMLADEVGLGKTIEAGLVLSQKWAERKRKLLVITPASLRKQWHQELSEKFFLPCCILEAKSYNAAIRAGSLQPFRPNQEIVVICSYQFARSKASDVANIHWDLAVIDEAHRLRNVYKPSNVIANILKSALIKSPKLLLTATPLQNSLLELFGLVSFIDEHAFGDLKSFREQFANLSEDEVFQTLKARLAPICHRTLRRQVLEYVPYTKRHALVEEFTPAESEDRLYNEVSAYLQRDNLQALPASQRSLMTLVLRKLLASSTFAIAGALDTLIARLKDKADEKPEEKLLEDELDDDYEVLDEIAEEWGDDSADQEPLSEQDRTALEREILDLEAFRDLALTITQNAKGKALLQGLDKAFAETVRLGAAKKAIIFTESRKTQEYLLRLLQDSSYADGIVLFNGSNTDDKSKTIYVEWIKRNAGSEKVSGSRTADMRSALVDYFRDSGTIMIATEAAAEGINLQFCSLVVNYDLPWNPQRIEQRIGRCHRYGQKHDVVVVNFLNRNNEADQRVFELLDQKFKLFEGVFGASDEVLGAIESGVDFEKRIARIYQDCRTPDEIRVSFARLQDELTTQINEAITNTRKQLLENFDEEVHEKLKVSKSESLGFQSRYERMLMRLSRHELNGHANFAESEDAFDLTVSPFPELDIPLGRYELPRRSGDAHLYRLGHPLARRLVQQATSRVLFPAEVIFDWPETRPRVGALEQYRGCSGEMVVSKLSVESMDQAEDILLTAAMVNDGRMLPADVASKFFSLIATDVRPLTTFELDSRLEVAINKLQAEARQKISERNGRLFEEEASKLDGWAEDLKVGLEREIKDLDRQLKEARRAVSAALSLEDKLAGQKQLKKLESERNEKRRKLFVAQDDIEQRRDKLIESVQAKLEQKVTHEQVLSICWRIV
ncbi:SNF2-related protein [Pirellula sp. SH-Sr6A]|uniref:SNF2-related protein n=1 Tax=Pirellula sp. SH-Sr6A TaxID=1632865 RepID=UPI0011BA60FF|nr:SNF2-related protein [Pirellula sp. SH-Sr6A]